MSFYGSVYYQLIDTFYKVVLRNKGINNTGFLDSDNIPAWSESQAVGRKGVFGFDSGNRWINLNTTEEKSDDKELYSIYEIYHGAPDPNANNINNGFKVHLSENELKNRTKDNVIQLAYEDEFETYETLYDDAGHIAKATKKTYKLPIAEVNEDVRILKELVGTKDGKTLPEVEDTKNDSNLYGYTEQNTLDIQELQNMVGSWTEKDNIKPISVATISEAIGNMNTMLGSNYLSKSSFKSLAEVIGNMSALWSGYDANLTADKKSIVETILDFKKRYDEYADRTVTPQLQDLRVDINNIHTTIGEKWTDALSIYTYISQLLKKDEDLTKAIQDGDNTVKTTLTSITDALDLRLDSAENRLDTIENTTIPSLQNGINTINNTTIPAIVKRIDAHEKNWDGTQAELEKIDVDLQASDLAINERIDNVINVTIKNLSDTVSNNNQDILDLIGEVAEDSTVMKTVQDSDNKLQGLINDLRTDLGTNEKDTNAFDLIQENTLAISTINGKIGEVSAEKSLAAQIGDINSSLLLCAKTSELNDYKTIVENTYATQENLQNNYVSNNILDSKQYITKQEVEKNYLTSEVAEQTYATTEAVSDISEAVEGIEKDIKTLNDGFVTLGLPGDFSDKVDESSTILASIFEKLSTLENDIIEIKNKINELHPDDDPSDPDNGENPNEPEDPELNGSEENPESEPIE